MRSVPAVHRLLEHPAIAPYELLVGRDALRAAVDAELDRLRAGGVTEPFERTAERVAGRVERLAARELRGVINATGTLLHTNLGRAPLAEAAMSHARQIACGYSNLEFDVENGVRGSRYDHVGEALCANTGAEDAVVVNNCAAAVLLIVDTFAKGLEVVVARNQLIEIGGGFRLPDVLARSGASLVEVGATNKVYLADYEAALSPRTALLMRSHTSNYAIEGFVHDVAAAELAALGARAGVPVVEDLGSGTLVDLAAYGLPHERTVQDALGEGMGLVAFSGDKLLGGPQAGIIAGSARLIARLRNNPLMRALRVDKVTLALLRGTLDLYRDAASRERIPFYEMLGATPDALRARAAVYAERVTGARVVECASVVGGGTLPSATIPSIGVHVPAPHPDEFARSLRRARRPIVARVDGAGVLLDLRTVAPAEDDEALAALTSLAR